MSWWALDVRTAPERRNEVGAWLVAWTGQAIEERDDGTLVTFAETEADAESLAAALAGIHGAEATRRPLDSVDWSTRWREGLEPRVFGRLTVTPSWIESGTPFESTVVLDPETAFGSGEHGSTRAALVLLERHLFADSQVLDLGSGSGILSIAAVKLGAGRATGIEIDDEANEVAVRNAARNGVTARTAFLHGEAASIAPLLGPVDMVVSNILRTVNTLLLPAIHASLRPAGLAIFAGMEQSEAELFTPVLTQAGFTAFDQVVDAGWWAVAARRDG
jgi:ribosomal protein L11 methyltransferase